MISETDDGRILIYPTSTIAIIGNWYKKIKKKLEISQLRIKEALKSIKHDQS